jgi:hypothetical protein
MVDAAQLKAVQAPLKEKYQHRPRPCKRAGASQRPDRYLTGVRSTGSIRKIGVGLPSRLSVTR